MVDELAKISGCVTPFAGKGRELGYPTANITSDTDLADGIYFGRADLAGYLNNPALIFIGTPVTVGDEGRRVEAHLLDIPDKDYYDQKLKISVQFFSRSSKKLVSIEQLMEVMKADERAAREWFEDTKKENK